MSEMVPRQKPEGAILNIHEVPAHPDWSGVRMPLSKVYPPTGIPFPICDHCNREVKTLDHWIDRNTHEVVLRAHCHGETETMRMRMLPTEGAYLTVGRAFVRKRLPVRPLPIRTRPYVRLAVPPVKRW